MRGHKWDGAKILAVFLPFAFLLAYLAGLPLPVPAFLLPERAYLALGRGAGAGDLRAARGSAGEAYAVLPDRLLPLPRRGARGGERDAAYEGAASLLPDRPSLSPLLGELASGKPGLRRARLVANFHPSAGEIGELEAAARKAGLPLALEIDPPPLELPLQSLSYRRNSAEQRLAFELLLSPEARGARLIEVWSRHRAGRAAQGPTGGSLGTELDSALGTELDSDGASLGTGSLGTELVPADGGPDGRGTEPSPESASGTELDSEGGTGASRTSLWRGAGRELPADLVLRLSVDRRNLEGIDLRVTGAGGQTGFRRLELAGKLEEDPRVLVVSEKADSASFIESLYPSKRVGLAAAGSEDLLAYELVVIDGLALASIDGDFKEGLLELASRRTGSILFAADSPDFGIKGDNPELEALLPLTLLPRSLKDLPDLAILIMIDTSGSMFGDKLSLAKVTGLELLRNLKRSDLVGMLLFSDERRWAYDFTLNGSISAAPLLEPLGAEGGTELAPALEEGLARLSSQGLKDKHVVIVSDGVTRPADFQALADRARQLGISISTMGIGEDLNRALLERLARESGGRFYEVDSVEEIPALLFEDRKSAARPPFAQGSIPVLALSGERVATIGGMAQYAAAEPATVLFTNDLGDPLFASRESGNRAVAVFTSDLYGGYTADFFSRRATAGAVKERLDALFSDRPIEVAITESSDGVHLSLRSDSLAAPRLLLSRAGEPPLEAEFERRGPELWSTLAIPPRTGAWRAQILDRGSSLASFPLAFNGGLGGVTLESARALQAWTALPFLILRLDALWLGLFFAASLAATVILRYKR